MSTFFLFFSILVRVLVQSRIVVQKVGVCPVTDTRSRMPCNVAFCKSDFECTGSMKCCSSRCGGAICSFPAVISKIEVQFHPLHEFILP
ncbi:unnamed protein product [Tenebrio molitor]|nr:unnamed protein product [Tenebrio molitor]